MKNRRIVVVALMLVAVLCVGVGYAAMQTTITFTGNINYTSEFPLTFTTNIGGTNANKVTGATVSGGDLEVTIDANGMDTVTNKTLTFTVEVENLSDYKAEGLSVVPSSSTNFDVSVVLAATTIEAGQKTTATVTITMTGYPVPASGNIATETVSFTVTGTQAAN